MDLPGMSDNVCKGPSLEEFHDNPKLVFDQEAVVHLNNVGVVIVTHNDNLSHKIVFTQSKSLI